MSTLTTTIQFRQGNATELGDPAFVAREGEPLYASDTKELYIQTSSGPTLIGPNAAPSPAVPEIWVNYSTGDDSTGDGTAANPLKTIAGAETFIQKRDYQGEAVKLYWYAGGTTIPATAFNGGIWAGSGIGYLSVEAGGDMTVGGITFVGACRNIYLNLASHTLIVAGGAINVGENSHIIISAGILQFSSSNGPTFVVTDHSKLSLGPSPGANARTTVQASQQVIVTNDSIMDINSDEGQIPQFECQDRVSVTNNSLFRCRQSVATPTSGYFFCRSLYAKSDSAIDIRVYQPVINVTMNASSGIPIEGYDNSRISIMAFYEWTTNWPSGASTASGAPMDKASLNIPFVPFASGVTPPVSTARSIKMGRNSVLYLGSSKYCITGVNPGYGETLYVDLADSAIGNYAFPAGRILIELSDNSRILPHEEHNPANKVLIPPSCKPYVIADSDSYVTYLASVGGMDHFLSGSKGQEGEPVFDIANTVATTTDTRLNMLIASPNKTDIWSSNVNNYNLGWKKFVFTIQNASGLTPYGQLVIEFDYWLFDFYRSQPGDMIYNNNFNKRHVFIHFATDANGDGLRLVEGRVTGKSNYPQANLGTTAVQNNYYFSDFVICTPAKPLDDDYTFGKIAIPVPPMQGLAVSKPIIRINTIGMPIGEIMVTPSDVLCTSWESYEQANDAVRQWVFENHFLVETSAPNSLIPTWTGRLLPNRWGFISLARYTPVYHIAVESLYMSSTTIGPGVTKANLLTQAVMLPKGTTSDGGAKIIDCYGAFTITAGETNYWDGFVFGQTYINSDGTIKFSSWVEQTATLSYMCIYNGTGASYGEMTFNGVVEWTVTSDLATYKYTPSVNNTNIPVRYPNGAQT